MPRSNIVYIHSHDTGRYVQPYGHNVPTPHIQRLAEQGVLFRKAFCAAPTCSPSRAALLTGQCPHSSGMLGLAHRGFALNDYGQHILHTLRRAGYKSILIGTQHVARDPAQIGYDRIISTGTNQARHVAPAAVAFLEQVSDAPFFLSIGFSETHRPFPEPSTLDDSRYCLPPHPLPDDTRTRHDMAAFRTSARALDQAIGSVIGALDARGLAENTLIICTTDHGLAFPGMKCNLTDHGIGVMLIMRGPGGFSGGQIFDAMISHVDLFPTICDLLEIEPPPWLQGKSMMPLIRQETDQINDQIYAEVTFHAAYEPQRAVRTTRWKYIRRFNERASPVLPNSDDSPSKDVWLEHGWREREPPTEQLYDLLFDPNEAHNLVGEDAWSAVRDDMRLRLDRWMQKTNDPLLQGDVPAPRGAIINDPDGLSPGERTIVVS